MPKKNPGRKPPKKKPLGKARIRKPIPKIARRLKKIETLADIIEKTELGLYTPSVAIKKIEKLPPKTELFIFGKKIEFEGLTKDKVKKKAFEATRKHIYKKVVKRLIDVYSNKVTLEPGNKYFQRVIDFLSARRDIIPRTLYESEIFEINKKKRFLNAKEYSNLVKDFFVDTALRDEFIKSYKGIVEAGMAQRAKLAERRAKVREKEREKLITLIKAGEKAGKKGLKARTGYLRAMKAKWRPRVIDGWEAEAIALWCADYVRKHSNFPPDKEVKEYFKDFFERYEKEVSEETTILWPETTEKAKEIARLLEEEKKRKKKGKKK